MNPLSYEAQSKGTDGRCSPFCAPSGAAAPLDMDEILRRCMGRIEFAERLLASFENRFPEELAEIEICLATADAPRLALLAHQLKGAAANMAAPRLQGILHEIETLARANRLDSIDGRLNQLRDEWNRFTDYRRGAIDERAPRACGASGN